SRPDRISCRFPPQVVRRHPERCDILLVCQETTRGRAENKAGANEDLETLRDLARGISPPQYEPASRFPPGLGPFPPRCGGLLRRCLAQPEGARRIARPAAPPRPAGLLRGGRPGLIQATREPSRVAD